MDLYISINELASQFGLGHEITSSLFCHSAWMFYKHWEFYA